MRLLSIRLRVSVFLLILLGFSLLVPGFESLAEEADPPNFIVIFCDDLGYADISPFGSEKHRTPNLDRMAADVGYLIGQDDVFFEPSRTGL